jgi:hypothetical protein
MYALMLRKQREGPGARHCRRLAADQDTRELVTSATTSGQDVYT